MKVYQTLADALIQHGVNTIFGLMGNSNLLYLPAFADGEGHFVRVVHEAGAVAMADGHSRMSGGLGVASVTHGPAFTNSLTSLVEAVRNCSHVLLITGDPPDIPSHFHHFDIVTVATAAGAGYEKVYEPTSLVRDLNRAIRRIFAEGRPVVLNVPISFMLRDAGQQDPVTLPVAPEQSTGKLGDTGDLDSALDLVASAKRPLILAGRGAVVSDAREELMALAGRIGAALSTTVLAKDLFTGHPRDIGIVGSIAYSVTSTVIAEADCIVAFGASLNMWTSLNGELFEGKRIVQVDTDPARFGEYTRVDKAVAVDARTAAAAMTAAVERVQHDGNHLWVQRVTHLLEGFSQQDDFTDRSGPDTVDARSAMIRLSQLLPEQRTVVSDIGRFNVGVWPFLQVANPKHFTTMGAFGSIGLGLAGAIGAALAGNGRPVVATLGDGGFMMHIAELTTAVREKLPIIIVVLNDGAYGAEHFKLENHGYDPGYSEYSWPDLAALAASMSARALTVRQLDELDAVGEFLPTLDGPLLVDVTLDPNVNLVRY